MTLEYVAELFPPSSDDVACVCDVTDNIESICKVLGLTKWVPGEFFDREIPEDRVKRILPMLSEQCQAMYCDGWVIVVSECWDYEKGPPPMTESRKT